MDAPGWVTRLRSMLAKPEPAIGTGDHCGIPFGCPFYAHCRAQEPAEAEYPVSVLPRAGQLIRILTEEGFEDLRSVPPERLSSQIHKRVHAAGNGIGPVLSRPSSFTSAGEIELSPPLP